MSAMWRVLRRRWWVWVAAGLVLSLLIGSGVLYAKTGLYGFNVMFRRGKTTWSQTGPDDPHLSRGVRLALGNPVPAATAGPLSWREAAPGFEVGELPVLAAGGEVDRILLTRIDPAHYRFKVLSRPAGDREIGDWMNATDAVLAVNGSYFAYNGTPDTPVLTDGRLRGPRDYTATHGAFVANGKVPSASLIDLTGTTWPAAFAGADNGLVSYPMLIDAEGRSRAAHTAADQLANRSFLGQDSRGRIVIGTTKDAFFSLGRLADFLIAAPLDLKLALNLDGGPVACQAVRLPGTTRDFCGTWETARHDGKLEVLGSLFGSRRAGLPLVIAAFPQNERD